jgi:hypothetical protein
MTSRIAILEYSISRSLNQLVAWALIPSQRVKLPVETRNLGISDSRILGFWVSGPLDRVDANLI